MIIDRFLNERFPDDQPRGIVHVGAHFGQEFGRYERLAPEFVVWIEADPLTYAKLLDTVREAGERSNVRHVFVNALISATANEPRVLHRFSNRGGSNSIFQATKRFSEAWPHVSQTGDSIDLVGFPLSDVLAENGIDARAVDILILDVQGAELECLRGARQILDSLKYIECEVSQEEVYDGGALYHEIIDYLDEAGFDLATDVPWHGDVVFQRRSPRGFLGRLFPRKKVPIRLADRIGNKKRDV